MISFEKGGAIEYSYKKNDSFTPAFGDACYDDPGNRTGAVSVTAASRKTAKSASKCIPREAGGH